MNITSKAFQDTKPIPKRYTCEGLNVSPPLSIEGVHTETKSLCLIFEDPDSPNGTFTHWMVWDIDPKTREIEEAKLPEASIQGVNDFTKLGYGGPCPQSGEHRYLFKLYALDTRLNLKTGSRRVVLETAMRGHIIDQARMMGTYIKQNDGKNP